MAVFLQKDMLNNIQKSWKCGGKGVGLRNNSHCMKRYMYILLAMLLCASCHPVRTFRVNNLVGREVQQTLNYPYSYDPVSIEVDSAFSPYDSPMFYDLLVEDMSLDISIEAYDTNIRTYLMTMGVAEKSSSPDARRQFEEARAELQKNVEMKREAVARQYAVKNGIERLRQAPRQFIGFKAYHKYHAMDNSLRLLLLHELFIVSPGLDAILGRYDLGDKYDQGIRERIEEQRMEDRKVEMEEI